jgi:hypothetical protein
MKDEIAFSKGVRGKFYRKNASIHLPIYLSADVQLALTQLANAKGKDVSVLVNEMIKKDLEIISLAS